MPSLCQAGQRSGGCVVGSKPPEAPKNSGGWTTRTGSGFQPGVPDVACMVAGELYHGCPQAFRQSGCTQVRGVVSSGVSAGEHDAGRCGLQRDDVKPVAADGPAIVLDEEFSM